MQYSPKLKKAMEEIKQVLKRHDIGATVVLHTPGFSEFLLKINPTYSCVTFNGDEIRIRAKLADFNGDKDKQVQKIEDSVNMLTHLSDMTGMLNKNLISIMKLLHDKMDIDTDEGDLTSHTTQNN